VAGIKQISTNRVSGVDQDRWLIRTIDATLKGPQRPARKGVFYPSALGNVCDRFLYKSYFGLLAEQPIDAITKRIFDCGDFLGYRYEKYFEKMGVLLATESPVKCEMPPISGRLDYLIKHEEHKTAIIELKSINTRGFKSLVKPKEEHNIQIQLYLNLTPHKYGIVLYECKDDQKIKAFSVPRDEKVWKDVKDRCLQIMEMTQMPEKCTGLSWCPCRRD